VTREEQPALLAGLAIATGKEWLGPATSGQSNRTAQTGTEEAMEAEAGYQPCPDPKP